MHKIAVLLGGPSSEHDISCLSGQEMVNHLPAEKYHRYPVYIDRQTQWWFGRDPWPANEKFDHREIPRLQTGYLQDHATPSPAHLRQYDVFLLGLHGQFGEDGAVQEFLDQAGCAYTGSGARASRQAMDKIETKKICGAAGLPLVPDQVLTAATWRREVAALKTGYPCVLKIPCGGSSIGVEMADGPGQAEEIAGRFFRETGSVLVEKRIAGPEFSCGVLEEKSGPRALPVTQIIPRLASFFDYKSKYQDGGATEITPAPISPELTEKIQRFSTAAFRALGCGGYCRVDFIQDQGTGEVYFLEVNTLPGFTTASIFPQEAAQAGLSFSVVLDILIAQAGEKRPRRPSA